MVWSVLPLADAVVAFSSSAVFVFESEERVVMVSGFSVFLD